MKILPLVASLIVGQSAFASIESVDLLKVTVDSDPTVSKLILRVDAETKEIKSGIYNDGSKSPPTFDTKKLETGVTLKSEIIPVTVLRTPKEPGSDSLSSSITSFFSTDEKQKTTFSASDGGPLELKILREGRGLTVRDYVRFSIALLKNAHSGWALYSSAKGSQLPFDAIHFTARKQKDLDKDFLASGLTLDAYCDKQSDSDADKKQKCVKSMNNEVGVKSLELTNEGKTVETLETTSLPGA